MKKLIFMLICVSLFGCSNVDITTGRVNPEFTLNYIDAHELDIDLIEILSDKNIIIGENDTFIIDEIHNDIVYFHKNTRDFTRNLYYTDFIGSFNLKTNEIINYESLINQKLVTFLRLFKVLCG